MTDSIKPPWAISLWYNADQIYAELPAIGGHASHVVRVPNDGAGLRKLLHLARSRDIGSKLGTKGDPTQAQIEVPSYDPKMVRRVRPKTPSTTEQRLGAVTILRKMGLI